MLNPGDDEVVGDVAHVGEANVKRARRRVERENDVRVGCSGDHHVRQQVVAREQLDPAACGLIGMESHLNRVAIAGAQRGTHVLEHERVDGRQRDQRGIQTHL